MLVESTKVNISARILNVIHSHLRARDMQLHLSVDEMHTMIAMASINNSDARGSVTYPTFLGIAEMTQWYWSYFLRCLYPYPTSRYVQSNGSRGSHDWGSLPPPESAARLPGPVRCWVWTWLNMDLLVPSLTFYLYLIFFTHLFA